MSGTEEHRTLLLIDGHSMAFRAFYALRPDGFVTKTGQYTNAVHGFTNTLLRLIKTYEPSHIAVAFDLPGGTFRTREYSEYKGGRKPTPVEFKGQIETIQDVLDVLGVSWLTYEDFEADDIVATLATAGEAAGMRVYLASGDKDSYQLVDSAVTLLYPMPRSEMLEMTPSAIQEKTGVPPELYSDVAALVGEKADNIPGVPGVGVKTAAKWINTYGGLTALLEHADELKGKVGAALREHAEQVKLNRRINRLVLDLPLAAAGNLDLLKLRGLDVGAMHALFDTLDFNSLRSRALRELPIREGSHIDGYAADDPQPIGMREAQVQIYDEAGEAGVAFSRFLANHSGSYGLAISGDTHPGSGYADAVGIAAQDGSAFVAHIDSLESSEFLAWCADTEVKKIGHSIKAMKHALAGRDILLEGVQADTELEAYILHPDRRNYGIADLALEELGVTLDDPCVAGARGQTALNFEIMGDSSSALDDSLGLAAVAVLNLHDTFAPKLNEYENIEKLMCLELGVCDTLFAMESRGVAVSTSRLAELVEEFDAEVTAAARLAHEAVEDPSLNLSSPKQLQKVLFEDLALPTTKKTKTGYTTNADALAGLLVKIAGREDDSAVRGQQFLSALLQHRDAIKLLQSVEGLSKCVGDDGRIHTTYQQAVAATGRLSSTDPNLQNIHARTEEGRQIREVFVPGEGFDYIMTADYSQIEMRLMAHLSGDSELIDAFNHGADLHKYVAARVFGVQEDEVTPAQRSRIKAMSYGLVYGLSAYGLSAQLNISVPEAQALMDGYFSRFGKVKHYLDGLVSKARRDGFTSTLMGRRRNLEELHSENRQVRESAERMALNAPIQGSAADIIKIAMVNTERALCSAGLTSRLLLQIHDELVLEVTAEEVERVREIVEREMGAAWPELSVPLTVGIGLGRHWREAAH